jgi:hypothetical protein
MSSANIARSAAWRFFGSAMSIVDRVEPPRPALRCVLGGVVQPVRPADELLRGAGDRHPLGVLRLLSGQAERLRGGVGRLQAEVRLGLERQQLVSVQRVGRGAAEREETRQQPQRLGRVALVERFPHVARRRHRIRGGGARGRHGLRRRIARGGLGEDGSEQQRGVGHGGPRGGGRRPKADRQLAAVGSASF